MVDVRNCEQCGAVFQPRREHARFCSARCRVTWNRHAGARRVETSALDWSFTAMSDVTERLGRVRAADQQHAFAVISEAVWWVTIVDGTLVRYHHDAYDSALDGQPPAERELIEGTLAGLRFVRNQMGYDTDHADFIEPRRVPGGSRNVRVTAWRWRPLPEPDLGSLAPRGRAWEMTRYHAYQSQLACHPVGETFVRATDFLNLVSATVGARVHAREHAAP